MGGQVETADLERFRVSPDRGFLPPEPPLRSFGMDAPGFCHRLDELAGELPALLGAGQLRPAVDQLTPPDGGWLDDLSPRAQRRVYTVCGFLANGYVHQLDAPTVESLPASLARPLYESASALGRTPVLSYDAYVLHNWRRIDAHADRRPHNLEPNVTFSDLRDERWFIAIHAAIESAAGPALAAIGTAQQGVVDGDPVRVHRALRQIEEAIHDAVALLDRMGEHTSPEQYGRGFRPYLAAIEAVEYTGVEALEGPQSFRGASGAQSSVFPALDAALGIDHGDNPLVTHLDALRADMPPAHRAFVEAAAGGPSVREFAREAGGDVADAYDECLDGLVRFRERHTGVVATYLAGEPGSTTGTGGTPPGRFLSMFVDDTRESRLRP